MTSDATHHPPPLGAGGRPVKVGVLSNPLSGGNRRGLDRLEAVARRHGAAVHRQASDPRAIIGALEAFAARGVELIAVNGGDGTIQAVLTGLFDRRPFARPPVLALLCGGTSNMIPKDVGIKGPQHRVLRSLLDWAAAPGRPARLEGRPVLRVAAGGEPVRYGMFFGAGCIHKGIRFFHERVNTLGLRGETAHGIIFARFMAALLSRRSELVAPQQIEVCADGRGGMPGRYLLLLVSSLEKLILGLRPYWGGGDGPLHMTAVSARPRRLAGALLELARGTPGRRLCPENGYVSRDVADVRLRFRGGYTLDGELYRMSAAPPVVTVSCGGHAWFLRGLQPLNP